MFIGQPHGTRPFPYSCPFYPEAGDRSPHVTGEESNSPAHGFLHWAQSLGLSASKAHVRIHRHKPSAVTVSLKAPWSQNGT